MHIERSPITRRTVVTGLGALAGTGLVADRAGASVPSRVASPSPRTRLAAAASTRPEVTSLVYHRVAASDFRAASSTVGWALAAGGLTVASATTVYASITPDVAENITDLAVFINPGGTTGGVRLLADNGAGTVSTLASGTYPASTGATTVFASVATLPQYANPETFSYTVAVDLAPSATLHGARVTAFTASSSLVFIDPIRVWDSRTPRGSLLFPGPPAGGRLTSGSDLTFTLDTVIPRFAYGPLLNVTLDQTIGSGYLVFFGRGEIEPTPPPISNINWYGPNQIVANLVVTEAVGEADVTIRAGGGGSTHFIIDVLGYFT